MKPYRLSLYLILFFYFALLVIVSFNIDRSINWISNNSGALPYFTLTGMGVFLVLFLTAMYDRRRYHRKIARQEAEKNEIKAKVYEMQRRNDETEASLRSFEKSLEKKEPQKEQHKTDQNL